MFNYLKLPTLANDQKIHKLALSNTIGLASALSISQISRQTTACTLVITSGAQEAITLEQDLSYLLGSDNVIFFPDWETLPYDTFSPYQDIVSKRLEILSRLPSLQNKVIITTVATSMVKLAPSSFIVRETLFLNKGEILDLNSFRTKLADAGYISVRQVLEHGEFSIRGSIIDIFPMGSNQPYRIDLFDNEVDSISIFDLETQRSLKKIDKISLLPAHEFPIDDVAINTFRKNYREVFMPSDITKHNIYQQISHKQIPAGIEYYLPLFFEQTSSIFEYLPQNSIVVTLDNIQSVADEFYEDVLARANRYTSNPDHPSLPAKDLFIPATDIFNFISKFNSFRLSSYPSSNTKNTDLDCKTLPPLALNHTKDNPTEELQKFIQEFSGKILFSVASDGRKSILFDLLHKFITLPEVSSLEEFVLGSQKIAIAITPFTKGVIIDNNLAIITETELLGSSYATSRKRGRSRTINPDAIIKNLAELTPGEFIVHEQYGIGKYMGLETLTIDNIKAEFVSLQYAKEAQMFVPITNLYLLSRYSGQQNVELSKLGTDAWKKARNKAINKIKDVAANLLDIYAKRALKKGFQYHIDRSDYAKFAAGFGYQTTEDQENAINAVLDDMASTKPMDRLICGDVGFGKTEVAMRAAFIAASNNKQVAILVPTTLLADQHYESFRDRFAGTPIEIASISRFKSAAEQKKVLQSAAEGKVDILIGTHKLLSKSLNFKNLGLLIVDEEHRFGVAQKEKIKALRAEVDILTMTATPIPRTLNMAMNGIRDLSIIATPPAKRLAVRTFVHEHDETLIREAVLRELKRGGQIYYLHNDVDSINKVSEFLSQIVPEAKIAVAHAQLPERELARIMHDFYHQRFNLLVCSTIIETGIDVPTANTIIMDRADKLGLAQLHQLRGRVGRSHHQAYAYLLTPPSDVLSADAKKRLHAIASLEELGSGFILATQDLEIRGAGEILGDEQSGQIEDIGFNLYTEMLEAAIEAIKEGRDINEDTLNSRETSIELHIPVLFPSNYIFDVTTRLSFYKRLASCLTHEDINEFRAEIIDRFGKLPTETQNLIKIADLRVLARRLGITAIEMNSRYGSIAFGDKINIKFEYLTGLITGNFDTFRPDGSKGLKIIHKTEKPEERLNFIEKLIKEMNDHYENS